MKPNDTEKKNVLSESISEMLWNAGEEKYACAVLNSQSNCFDMTSNGPNKKSSYVADGYTERLHLFEFTCLKELKLFIKKNLSNVKHLAFLYFIVVFTI